jgi:GTPase KRas
MSAVKLIVMGAGGVGKSALSCRYTQGTWVEKYDPTIEDQYTKTVELDTGSGMRAVPLEILDTAGQDEYSPLRETFMHTGDGFLLVYSITDDDTYEALESIHQQILRVHQNPAVPMLVIGNKSDLEDDRAVQSSEGQQLAKKFNAQFMEISAKKNEGVNEAFETLLRSILSADAGAGGGGGDGGVLGAGQQPAAAAAAPTKKKKGCTIL